MTTSRQTTIDEVNGLSQIYSAAHALPEPQHTLIRSSIREYVTTVINTEWPLMSGHRMWFVYELNYPFSGGLTVKPDAYLIFLQQASPPSQ